MILLISILLCVRCNDHCHLTVLHRRGEADWVPGTILRICGRGLYDVAFTDAHSARTTGYEEGDIARDMLFVLIR